MKNKLTETKFKSALGLTCHLISRALCLGAVMLICTSALAENLFVSGGDANGGKISKFTWDALQSTFASGLRQPQALAFDSAGNLFVSDYGIGSILEFKPNGARRTFALGLAGPMGLAIDGAGNLFVADYSSGGSDSNIYEFTPRGVRSTVVKGSVLDETFL